MTVNYARYLKLDRLLDLQEPLSRPEQHDERLFITIHQVYELWFKQILHEMDRICDDLSANRLFEAIAGFQRVRTILKTVVGQLDILETMTPISFAGFRERLETASGFQSAQFREIEFLLGYKRPEFLRLQEEASAGRRGMERRLAERSIVDHFYDLLEQRGLAIPRELREKPIEESTRPSEALQEELFRLYLTDGPARILFELMLDVDEGLQEWRYRHVKLAERTIGNKAGTGETLGVDFLKRSLFKPVFPDLWALRHRM